MARWKWGEGKGEEVSLFMWMHVCGSMCVRVLGRLLLWGLRGVGCLWDLPLSVIEKCDLENVCPAEHESYLHGDGGVFRGGSPGPWQGEPVIGWELTLRATLSLRHTHTHRKKNALTWKNNHHESLQIWGGDWSPQLCFVCISEKKCFTVHWVSFFYLRKKNRI